MAGLIARWAGWSVVLSALLIGAALLAGAADSGPRQQIAFYRDLGDGRTTINLLDADRLLETTLLTSRERIVNLSWSPDGERLAFTRYSGGAYRLDLLTVPDGTVTIFDTVYSSNQQPAWSPDGARLVHEQRSYSDSTITVLDARTGATTPLLRTDWAGDLDWSPDGRSIVFSAFAGRGGTLEVLLMTPDCAPDCDPQRITENQVDDYEPRWSPDGTRLAFLSDRAGGVQLYVLEADCLDCPPRPVTGDLVLDGQTQYVWSPDGQQIAVQVSGERSSGEQASGFRQQIYLIDLDCTRDCTAQVSPADGRLYRQPAFAPDGVRVAFVIDQLAAARQAGIGISPVDGCCLRSVTARQTVASNPVWRPD